MRRLRDSPHLSTRQYARIVHRWVMAIGLNPTAYGTHTMRRTKAALIYRRTKNLRVVQLLLGHSKLEKHCQVPRDRRRRRAGDCGADGGLGASRVGDRARDARSLTGHNRTFLPFALFPRLRTFQSDSSSCAVCLRRGSSACQSVSQSGHCAEQDRSPLVERGKTPESEVGPHAHQYLHRGAARGQPFAGPQ